MGVRREGREIALQALYLSDTCRLAPDSAIKTASGESGAEPAQFARHLVEGVAGKKEEIDRILARYTENWAIERMATVDRNILRLSTFELMHDLETPVSVIIDEAIEIAKTYSTEESGKFVNGILDKVKKERKPAQ